MRTIQILVLLTLVASQVTYSISTNETDQHALLAFKSLITDDPLGFLNSWNRSTRLCEWSGITCSPTHNRVTILDLSSKHLTGTLSPFLGNLSFLKAILVQDNYFIGSIPTELSSLFRLQNMNLTNNGFQGEIPANLSSCTELKILNLMFNDLIGKIPSSFGSLSRLTNFSVFSNNLIGEIPTSLGNLTLLKLLSLGTNGLSGTIPSSIGYLTRLGYFGVGLNQLSGAVPPSLYNMTSLADLVIPENQLTGSIPSDIGLTLPNLRFLSTGGNNFQGPFPFSLSNSSRMRLLDLSESNLYGSVPSDLGTKMKYLWWLNLQFNNLGAGVAGDLGFLDSLTNSSYFERLIFSGNSFGGNFPRSITNLSAGLTILAAGGNRIFGKIPAGISKYENLLLLDFEQNRLSGSVPPEMGKLTNLQRLYINQNSLSGQIPLSVGNLTKMFDLNLQENSFTGTIPSSIIDIQSLQTMNLSHNSLEGPIPKSLALISVLTFIDLAHNSFSSPLPLEFGNLKNLQELDVSDNNFSGQIPTTLGSCSRLESLLLNGNSFEGSIPASFSSLKGIRVLDLSRNNLSGKIPLDLQTVKSLEKLNLSFNHLTGEVPSLGVFKNTTAVSLVGNKELCGGVPGMHFQACPSYKSKANQRHKRVTILIPCLIIGSLVILALVVLLRKRKQRKSLVESPIGRDFTRLSYDQLLKATDGFSSTNLIGSGGFGSVYKGIIPQGKKPVAIKVINLEKMGASKSFIAECEALKQTRHRNLLKIVTVCSSVNHTGEDFKALVLEYMPNGSLESWLHPREKTPQEERKLDLGQRLNIAIDIASALDYLYHGNEMPIIHCDLKPSNVLIDEDMTARVGDFGLSKFLAMSSSITDNWQTDSLAIKGSIGYVAPEYGLGGRISAEGDVYSYGIILLEMVTGKRPTDEKFTNGMNLHEYCKTSLPDRVDEVVNSQMLLTAEHIDTDRTRDEGRRQAEIRKCLISLVRIGVACSEESPSERMDTSQVLLELTMTREVFLGVGIHGRTAAPH